MSSEASGHTTLQVITAFQYENWRGKIITRNWIYVYYLDGPTGTCKQGKLYRCSNGELMLETQSTPLLKGDTYLVNYDGTLADMPGGAKHEKVPLLKWWLI